ncbi:5-(carboxyamino)imidazole ribonucleotide synthase [Jatrophihabitans telluris]|uniref:N5-carboxyaminoimidazole ribonucleotide synthase n=1 Tax=Jatrophihabitans telluris TaxID=2038343 RepID=A0ABY4R3H8_9ACTN|nr:5-(carboxyamino)imidazole ribonucleotide synthase [Jatrophihabitans telluris]UQX89574.1 5-(carboxyamino)imidazole ribonucleotide synthase [Jatrophihabitans telluris]
MDKRTGLPVVGMVGAGQLARMTHQAAIALGQSLKVLADGPDDGAAVVAGDVMVGDYRTLADLQAFAAGCDVVTFDHEHVPPAHIQALEAAGSTVWPSSLALRFAQDKAAMRQRLSGLGAPCPPWRDLSASADPAAELADFAAEVGWPVVLKAVSGGYDGKGVWVVQGPAEAAALLESGTPLLAEQAVDIDFEIAALVARSPYGQGATWPIVETVQQDGICTEVIAPAPRLSADLADQAQELGLRIAAELGVVGILAVELFVTRSGALLVNELAMRPHNSGHWTIEGSRTSQFEQHLRAVLDYPLGSTTQTAPWVVMANVLGGPDETRPALDERVHHLMAHWPDVKIHLYGKGFRPGRKVGHVTALGPELPGVRRRARAAADYLAGGDVAGFGEFGQDGARR